MIRVIPIILVKDSRVYQSLSFRNLVYLGDPQNTLSIFSHLPVDELIILSLDGILSDQDLAIFSNNTFIPVGYGGGIRTLEDAKRVFAHGYEKIVIRSGELCSRLGIRQLSSIYGNSSISVKFDYQFDQQSLVVHQNGKSYRCTIEKFLNTITDFVEAGAGEIILTNMDRVGTWKGADWDFGQLCQSKIPIPLIINGGIGSEPEIIAALENSHLGGIGISSFFSFAAKDQGVLIHVPSRLEKILEQRR